MKSILIVDDNHQNLYMLEIMLKNKGFHVITAINGAKGLHCARKKPPDLIISDILMPEMDGFVFLRELKKVPDLSLIPFIYYTATYIDKKDETFALSLGARKFIRKPMKAGLFLKEITEVIENPTPPSTETKILDPTDNVVYKLYSERLIQKLEKKTMDLENEIHIRKETEKALKESEERFRQVIENIREVFWIRDVETGKFIYVSPHTNNLFGIPPEALEENPDAFMKNIVTSDQEMVQNAFENQKKEAKTTDYTYRITGENQSIKWVRARTFPIFNASKKQIRIAGIAEDITRNKMAEMEKESLRLHMDRSQKLEAIGTLAGGIAHDFNNILSSILGFSELTLEDLDTDSTAYEYTSEIFTSAKRARELVKQILTFTQHKEPELKPVNVGHIIEEVLKLLRPSIPSSIQINHGPLTHDGYVMADATKIHQVIMNICTNASHAMEDDGGCLVISLTSVNLRKEDLLLTQNPDLKKGPYIKLTIEDSGLGIAPDHIDKIFDPFFTTKSQDQGVGLGLSVVHGIICSHNGAIHVESQLGKGCAIHIHLPISKHARVHEGKSVSVLSKGDETILFVDDESTLVTIGEQRLNRLGYTVETSTHPIKALMRFKESPQKYDLIITDMTMPEMTGDELARQIISIRPEIPIIILTGYSKKISHEKAKNIGITSMMMKPVIYEDLFQTIRKILDGS